jgi:tagatose-1,6-bisphosphate aldolase non-catalytic subunit AgaZ/GatZ
MAASQPDLAQLLAAMYDALHALQQHVGPAGRFELRVLVHALEIVQREVVHGPAAHAQARQSLRDVLAASPDDPRDVAALSDALCEQLRSGALQPDDPQLLSQLRACVMARLAIDNPDFR